MQLLLTIRFLLCYGGKLWLLLLLGLTSFSISTNFSMSKVGFPNLGQWYRNKLST